MRQTISGTLEYRLLAQFYKPTDPAGIAQAARRLAALGWKAQDIAETMGMSTLAVQQLLAEHPEQQQADHAGNRVETHVEAQ